MHTYRVVHQDAHICWLISYLQVPLILIPVPCHTGSPALQRPTAVLVYSIQLLLKMHVNLKWPVKHQWLTMTPLQELFPGYIHQHCLLHRHEMARLQTKIVLAAVGIRLQITVHPVLACSCTDQPVWCSRSRYCLAPIVILLSSSLYKELAHVCGCWKDLSRPEVVQTTSLASASNFDMISWMSIATCIANDQSRHSRARGSKLILHFPVRSFTRQSPQGLYNRTT